MSKNITDDEKNSSYELEMIAIKEALMKFRFDLYGILCKRVTDSAAFYNRQLTFCVTGWALQLQKFNYEFEYLIGIKIVHALISSPVNVICISVEGDLPKVNLN